MDRSLLTRLLGALLCVLVCAPLSFGVGNPVLLVGSTSNPFSTYNAEILKAEGVAFDYADLSSLSSATLAPYDVVVVGQVPLSADQVNTLTTWVNAGGRLVALRPDKQLAGLLGLADTSTTLTNGYILVNTASVPGAGIVGQTIQFHGTADLYSLSGAVAAATLYATAGASTPYPAVSVRTGIGTGAGSAAAFTYDLARSVVYTRQGNPAWAGQARVQQGGPIRAGDMFYGSASFDPQPDWIDLNKVAMPQADEQQRLLINLILHLNQSKKPIPRFWYLPFAKKAAVVMTGDDHGNNGTAGRFDLYNAASTPGCSVANWECVRATSYIYPSTLLTNTQAAAYVAQGFEVALHVSTGCADYTPGSIENDYSSELAAFATAYPSVPVPVTNRTHCIAWSDWASQAVTSLAHGIRLDTNYYYWPPSWVQNRPGFFTGSGIPMRFAQPDGTQINVYQATTQMTDESEQVFPFTIDSLLDNAVGANGYYGVFTANMHTDSNSGDSRLWSDQIVASAQARGVPIVSAKQMLQWLDGRDASSFSNVSFSGNTLTFSINAASGTNGLQGMLPTTSPSGVLAGLSRSGTPVGYSLQTIKGVQYALFPAVTGTYSAVYSGILPPVISAVTVTPGTTTATITWTTDKPSSSRVDYGPTTTEPFPTFQSDSALVTSHTLNIVGLTAGATYYFRVSSVDASAGTAVSPTPPAAPATFVTIDPNPPVISAVTATPGPGGTATITWTTNKLSTARVDYGTSPTTLNLNVSNATLVTAHSITLTGLTSGATYYYRVTSADSLNNSATSPNPPAAPLSFLQSPIFTIWSSTAAPGIVDAGDTSAVELGVKFRSDISGLVTGVRFYKSGANTGIHVGNLWSSTGTLLGTVIFTNETASGWQQANFATPIAIAANTTYIVSYFAPNGHYSGDNNFFSAAGVDNPPLHALRNGVDGPNGVYRYGSSGGFPDQTFNSSNYWVDVVVIEDNQPPIITSVTATPTASAATITWNTNKVSNSRVDYGTSPTSLTTSVSNASMVTAHTINLAPLITGTPYYYRVTSLDSQGNSSTFPALADPAATFTPTDTTPPIITGVTATPGSGTATIAWTTDKASTSRVDYGTSPSSLTLNVSNGTLVTAHSAVLTGLTSGITYYYRVTSADGLGNSATSPAPPNAPASFGGGGGISVWTSSATPAQVDSLDTGAVELGMKFRSDVAGYVTGVRFYKANANTGTHIGNLWSSSGVLLGTVTFTNETTSGWQQASFPSLIPIAANTTYVVSYFAPNGRYSDNLNFFTSTGVDTPPLHALRTGVDGPNGVYRYGSTSGFPNSTWSDTNYWVDLVFVADDGIPPRVTTFTIPGTAISLTIPITSFIATDNSGVTGYLVTESATNPSPGASGWSASAPTSYTFASGGSKTLYAWAKDVAQNVSTSMSATVVITLSDTTPPTVNTFTIPASATTLTVAITSFTATDNTSVAGYFVTESAVAPSPAAPGWSATVPASYAFTSGGSKTLYAWAKDGSGNVSTSRSASVAITITSGGPEPAGWYSGDMHVHRSCVSELEAPSSLLNKMSVHNLAVISLLADMGNGDVQDPTTDLPLINGNDDPISTAGRIVHWDAEWHWDATYTHYSHQALGGHIVALGLTEASIVWDESTYNILNWAHQRSAVAGFVHMQYLDGGIPQSLSCCTPIEYPVEVALGAADFISEDVDDSGSPFSMNPDAFIEAYYKLLNSGFRPGFAAGTDYPCNGSRPLGALLTYAQPAGGQMTYRNWINAIAQGRTVVSRNGHNEFLNLIVNGTATPGDQVNLAASGNVNVTVQWSAAQNLTGTIELVSNGIVVASNPASVASGAPATWNTTISFPKSGWLAARRMGADGHQVHTAAVFVIVNNAPIRASVADAEFYVQWMDNLLTRTAPGGPWNAFYPTNLALAQSRYQAAKATFQQRALEAAGGPAAPTLTSISPNSGVLGATIGVTLSGTNLSGAALNLPVGITLSGTPVVSPTQITATFVIAANATVGPNSVTVTGSAGTSNAVTFAVNTPAPTLASITPTSGAQGGSVAVSLAGTNLTGATLNLPAGITASGTPVVNATLITATLLIDPAATPGARSITVTTPFGTSNAVTFTVTPPAPVLTSITPSSGERGTSVPVTFAGANLTGATLTLPSGITSSGTPVVSATQITVTLVIAANATTGARSITATTAGGVSNALIFTVIPPPALTSITPTSGVQGASVGVTLAGSNLTGASLNLPVGITISGTPVVGATQITATFVIAPDATPGARSVTVTSSAGTSNAVTFTVTSPAPVLTSITPSSGARSTTVPVTLVGTNLTGATLNLPSGITNSGTPVVSATQITATLVIAANATTGARSITATTAGGVSNALTFTVIPLPTLTSIAPTSGAQGASIGVTLTGTNLTGATVNPPAGITIGGTPVVTATQITATFVIAPGASTGARSVTVTTAGGTSNARTFTVNPPAPVLASITPSSGARSTTVPVTLVGTNLTGATLNLPSGITSSGTPVVSATQITATFVIAANATTGARNIRVNTTGGQSNAVTFTVIPPPTFSSIAPTSGVRGTSVPVTLNGSNLTGAVVNVPAGITVTGTSSTATSVTATFVISPTATAGAKSISVTTAGGTSVNRNFTVTTTPVITSVSPTSLARGAATTVVISGINLTATTTVSVTSSTGITIGAVTFVNENQISVPITVALNAAVGNRTLRVTAGGLTSNGVTVAIQ